MSRTTPLVEAFRAFGRVADCPIVDLHTHPDAFQGIYFPAPDVDGILRTMDRANVRTIAIAPHTALFDPAYGNPIALRMAEAHPDRFRLYLCFNPHYPGDLDGLLPLLTHPSVVGFKIHPSGAQSPLAGEGYAPLLAAAAARGCLVLAHTWRDSTCDAAQCRQVLERHPDLRLLMGHACFDDWYGAFALAREFPNAYLELTAAAHVTGVVDEAVAQGLAHKMLFGTDLPWFDPFTTLGCIVYADIEDADRHAILHGNAERLLGEIVPARVS
jgi:predicted TIM-barrel fold metal-dependent hydrolase